MKKITFILIAFFVSCFTWQGSAQTFTATDTPQTVGPAAGTVTTSIATSTTAAGVVGLANGEYTLNNVTMNIDHSWADDLDIRLTSPGGAVTVDLSTDNGGRFGLTPAANLVFTDASANDVTTWVGPPPAADYQAEAGLLNTLFAGQPANGNWTLTVTDDTGGDSGNLNSYSITLSLNVGQPPAIACPSDIMINTTGGICTGTTNWNTPLALDPEDGPLTPTQTAGPMSGTPLAPGMYVVTYSVTDSDGNTSTCSFNITVSDMEAPIAVCQDISLDLDATGSVTITAADLDNGSTDNCGIVSSTLSTGTGGPNTLMGSFAAGNGQAGNMFDVNALTSVTINSFDVHSQQAAGVLVDFEVYFKTGTWVGSDMTPGDWTLVGTVIDVPSAGPGVGTPLGLSLGINVAAGNTVAFYVTATDGLGVFYTNGPPAVGAVWQSDANLEILGGAGKVYPFVNTFQPRNFNGNILYDSSSTPFNGTFDCSNLGANVVNVTHTDAAGNSTTCMATVTILDVTAPVVTCIGQPANLTDSSSASPNLPIVSNAGPVLSTLTVTDDFVITDLDVDLDISHTWVGDLVVTLTAPTGESAILIDRMGVPATGAGCSSDDLMITLDDEATDPIEDACDAGPPAASGSFTPNNPLSVFDGVSTVGDWILSVDDTVGGDDGNFNSWGLSYSHDVSGSPLEVTLDANGMATINASALLLNVDEACSWTATVPAPGGAGSLTTTFDGGNGQAGNMFDVKALNNLTIDSFDVSIDDGVTDTVEVYFKTGTWVGSDMDAAAWTLLATIPGVTSAGQDVPTPLNQTFGVNVTAGDTVAFYVTLTTTTAINYTNGTTVGALFASDANMEFYEGAGKVYPFANTFQPRNFNGNIVYTSGGGVAGTLDLDCSMLGSNLIEVTVTDGSGNVATCMATVVVKDETAPVLVCAADPVTIELGPDGTATIDAMALLGFVDSTYTVLVIGSDNASNAVGFTDLTVPVTAAETVSFDWDYVLNDIPGFDSFGYLLNGTYTELIDPAVGNQTGNASIALVGGDVFGFRSQTSDNLFGNNETVISNFLPGFTGQFDPANWTETLTNSDGSATFVEIPGGPLSFDACGIATMGVSQTTVTCANIGTPLTITVFAADASGNSAACTTTVNVVDALAPIVTCPADQTVDPGPGNLFYSIPDYVGTGEATAVDNCTTPVAITTQNPAPGTLVSDGTYSVTITGEDASGNVGTCTFTLTVTSVLGVESNELSNAIAMFPNPAREQVTISNSSNIQLEKAMIYDLNGKMVNQINLRNMQGEQVVDVSALASGVYVIQLTSDKSSAVKRLIKE